MTQQNQADLQAPPPGTPIASVPGKVDPQIEAHAGPPFTGLLFYVAILFSVLLTVPFSARFEDVDPFSKGVYVTALVLSASTTVTLIGPVAFHRLLFAKGRKPHLVQLGDRMAVTGLGLLCLTLGAVLLLVTDVVLDRPTALVVSAAFTVSTAALWSVPAALARRR